MWKFIKSFFQSNSTSARACCGGGCADHCGVGSLDLEISESDKKRLSTIDENVVVGKILEIAPHPSPEMTKVRVTRCDTGNGIFQILCGGVNIAVGQIVPVAKVGSVLPGDFSIGKREIRGVISEGMICASKELGLERSEGEKHIWELPKAFESYIGTPIAKLV